MRLKVVKEQADENTFLEWRDEDYMNKMEFNPLVLFVVIMIVISSSILSGSVIVIILPRPL